MPGWGQISEIFDADEPHNPRGCIAQAWSLAELLRLAKLVTGSFPEAGIDVERQPAVTAAD